MKNHIIILILSCVLFACKNENTEVKAELITSKFQNKGHELVFNMVQKVGDLKKLKDKKDVSYTYTYQTPNGDTDVSTEKYIFNGEYSYGRYIKHERTLPKLNGIIEQGYNGNEFWLKQNGEILLDKNLLKKVAFNRPTNFYWFTMMQKLLDPGLNYEYIGPKSIANKEYDIVKITFNSEDGQPKDIYQLYINKSTLLVDQFLFTVADYGITDPKLMQLEYEEIAGLYIPTQRKYKNSNWNADLSNEAWVNVTWSNIKFNTEISEKDFNKENVMKTTPNN